MICCPKRQWPADTTARAGTVRLRAQIRVFVFALCAAFAAAPAAWADNPTFAELLARAKAQAAAGHRSAPPGDNMIETIAGMVDLAPTATPAQLEELVTLLDSDKPAHPQPGPVPPSPDTPPAAPPAPTSAAVNPPAPETPPAPPAPTSAAADTPYPANTSRTASLPATLENPSSGASGTAQPAQPSPRPKPPGDAAARAAALFDRGQAAEAKGDFSGARRLYGSAAEWGNAAAARSLGRLYDPAYIRLNAMGGVDPDPVLARSWYERAMRMGDPSAGPLLNALSTR